MTINDTAFDKHIHDYLQYMRQIKDIEDRLKILTTHLHMIGEDMAKSRLDAYKCVETKEA